jgi:hypothetical protein
MESIKLTKEQRAALVRTYIEAGNAIIQRRAQYLLLLDDGHSADYVAEVTYSEPSEVTEAIRSFREGGLTAFSE